MRVGLTLLQADAAHDSLGTTSRISTLQYPVTDMAEATLGHQICSKITHRNLNRRKFSLLNRSIKQFKQEIKYSS